MEKGSRSPSAGVSSISNFPEADCFLLYSPATPSLLAVRFPASVSLAVLLSALLVIATGCASETRIVTEAPRSLAEVNRLLADRDARIELLDGSVLEGYDATVAVDSVRFASRSGTPAVATPLVRRVVVERKRLSVGKAAGGGFLFGVAVAGLIAADLNDTAIAFTVLSPLFGMGGAVVGGAIGLLDRAGSQTRTAYEAPLSAYMGGARE